MKVYVGLTDPDWISAIAAHPELESVNFWFPGESQDFAALDHGEIFLFKSKARDGGEIVGGAIFDTFLRARLLDAWDWFGAGNGVGSVDEFADRVRHYRRQSQPLAPTTEVGCALLSFVQFFPSHKRVVKPADWANSIVRGKLYETGQLPPNHSVNLAVSQLLGVEPAGIAQLPPHLHGQVYGDPTLTVPRYGQEAFKAVIAHNYGYRCAITGDRVRPVLEAAHILPVAHGGMHRPDNGILLRSDIHTLFDRGYVGIDPKMTLMVSPHLREEFGNGDALYAKAGSAIAAPDKTGDRPNREFLEWHLETVYRHR